MAHTSPVMLSATLCHEWGRDRNHTLQKVNILNKANETTEVEKVLVQLVMEAMYICLKE